MNSLQWLLVALVSLMFSALFSGVEIAYITSDRVATGITVKRGGLLGKIVNLFYRQEQLFISTILVGNNIMLVVYGMGAAALLDPWLEARLPGQALVLLCSTLISTFVILFVGEFFPKSIFRINPNTSLKLFAVPVLLFYVVLFPLAWFTTRLSRALMRLAGMRSEATSLHLLSTGDLNRYIESRIDNAEESGDNVEVENEVRMFHNALDFSETELGECMIPRNEIVAVDVDECDREELSQLFTSSGRSKIVVYRGDIDNILGYIHVSELFEPDVDWRDMIKPVVFAPETLLADKMMRRLLQQKKSLAIVFDEFGGTAGLVTLEDLVEEIFGDIKDEHDREAVTAKEVAPGVWDFSGRIEVRLLNEEYKVDIPEDDAYQTLAGYLMETTGEIPRQGAVLTLPPYRFTILKGSATRLELIRVEPADEADDDKNDNSAQKRDK